MNPNILQEDMKSPALRNLHLQYENTGIVMQPAETTGQKLQRVIHKPVTYIRIIP